MGVGVGGREGGRGGLSSEWNRRMPQSSLKRNHRRLQTAPPPQTQSSAVRGFVSAPATAAAMLFPEGNPGRLLRCRPVGPWWPEASPAAQWLSLGQQVALCRSCHERRRPRQRHGVGAGSGCYNVLHNAILEHVAHFLAVALSSPQSGAPQGPKRRYRRRRRTRGGRGGGNLMRCLRAFLPLPADPDLPNGDSRVHTSCAPIRSTTLPYSHEGCRFKRMPGKRLWGASTVGSSVCTYLCTF